MSIYLYITRLKCLIRHKENMFWSFLFPILLSTCFFFAFNNFWSVSSFESIPILYVRDSNDHDPLKDIIETAMMDEETPFFSPIYGSQEEASLLLEDDKIDAYIVGGENPELYIKKNGVNQTITKSFLDNYNRISTTLQSIIMNNPNALKEVDINDLMNTKSFVEENSNGRKPDMVLIYFYSLLAFTCIMSCNWGLDEVMNIQANQSTRGARINVSPVHKMKLFFSNIMAAYTIQCVSILLLIGYLSMVLQVDFAGEYLAVILISLLGSFVGLTIGGVVGIYLKKSLATKNAILTVIMLVGGCLSGMMVSSMNYLVAKHAPIIGYLNPINLITDALYSIYYYDNYNRFLLNALILSLIGLVLSIAVLLGVRRKNYANI